VDRPEGNVDGPVHRRVTGGKCMTVVRDAVRPSQAGIGLVLDGHSLKIEDVAAVARHRQPIQLHPDAVGRINKCRGLLERKIQAAKSCTESTRALVNSRKSFSLGAGRTIPEILALLHAAGCGEPCREEDVRAGMLSRLNTHCWGHSGIRREVVEIQIEMLNRGVTRWCARKGRWAHVGIFLRWRRWPSRSWAMASVLPGERWPAKEGLAAAGISPIAFRERDGLGHHQWLRSHHRHGMPGTPRCGAMAQDAGSLPGNDAEALNANMVAYDPRFIACAAIRERKPAPRTSAGSPAGSELLKLPQESAGRLLVRSSPQVHRRRQRRIPLEPAHAGDRTQSRRRQPGFLSGRRSGAHRRQLPRQHLGVRARTGWHVSNHRCGSLRTQTKSAHESSFVDGAASFPYKGAEMFSGLMLTQLHG